MMNMYSQVKENNRSSVPVETGQRKPSDMIKSFQDNRPLAIAQRKMCDVIQQKKVTTNYGDFETTKFTQLSDGVDIELEFDPNAYNFSCFGHCPVNATKIGMVQSVCSKDVSNNFYAADPRRESRMVKAGSPGKGYVIDRIAKYNVPVYGVEKQGVTELKDVDKDQPSNPKYRLGKCCKDGKENAWMHDAPYGETCAMFETTALALDGADKDKYYGSVKWGYTINGGTLTTQDISLVSKGDPSPDFIEPAKLWNESAPGVKAKSGGSFKAKNNLAIDSFTVPKGTPYAADFKIVLWGKSLTIGVAYRDAGTNILNKDMPITLGSSEVILVGTDLDYVSDAVLNGGPAIYVKVPSVGGILIYVSNGDIDLQNDGVDNVPLPIPPVVTP